MKNIFKLSSFLIVSTALMAVKCGDEEIPFPPQYEPNPVTYREALTNDSLLDLVITITDSVFFVEYKDSISYNSSNSNANGSREITNCNGETGIVVFTSTTREFAYEIIPDKMGPITGILSVYNDVRQLLLRDLNDVADMTAEVCEIAGPVDPCDETGTVLFSEDWESQSLGSWTSESVVGSFNWSIDNLGSENSYYAKGNGFSSGAKDAEMWLISPNINLSSSGSPKLSFRNAYNYDGPALEVYVATDYTSGDPNSSGTWTKLSPSLSGGGWEWECSGALDLSAHKASTTRIAFKYTSNPSDGASTWEVDDIVIQE